MKKNYERGTAIIPIPKKILRIMKLTAFLILIAVMHVSASGYSQNTRLSISMQETSIKDVLHEIEKLTDFRFIYSNESINLSKKVSINSKDERLKDILKEIFRQGDVNYTVTENNLVLINPLKGDLAAKAGQLIKVSGMVTDNKNEPLPGVTVVIKGTNKGAITDANGHFEIPDVMSNSILVFSFVGMKAQAVEVKGRKVINVVLSEDSIGLDEVVAIGYGTSKKSNLTGAIASVKSEDLENRTIVNAEDALSGKTAGVQLVQTSGAPSSTSTVRIRGYSSNSSSDPLYVVDGLRVDDISAIDPNNIASMEILKDAASAAIYGMEAGNGVILITTKTGAVNTNGKISYDFQYTFNSLSKVPKVMNAEEYIEFMEEGDLILDSDVDSYYDGTTDTDWSDVAFETSLMKKHNISFESGSNKGNLFVSLSYLDQDGIVTGNSDIYQRITAHINGKYQIKPWLDIGVTTNMEKSKSKTVSENTEYGSLLASVLTLDPLTPEVYDSDNIPSSVQSLIDAGKELVTNDAGQYYGISQFFESENVNPLIERDINKNRTWGYNIMGTIFADLTPIKGLKFTSKVGYKLYTTNYKQYIPEYYVNSTRYSDNITMTRYNYNGFYYQWENFVNYNFKVNSHHFNVLLGTSFDHTDYDYVYASGDELSKSLDNYQDISYLSSDATKTVYGYSTENADLSYFGRISYNFMDRYMFQAILRRDACDSSKLSDEKRWGTFPSASLGWIISKENFFPQQNFIDQVKLRASWGENGSTGPLGDYSYTSTISSSTYYPFSSTGDYQLGSAPDGIANSDLKWETSEQLDFGVDFHAFKNKLNFTADYYKKTTKDLLVEVTPPLETGVSSSYVNAGDVKNTGWEFELGWRNKIGKDFSYQISGNLATLKNEVTYLDPSISRISGAYFTSTNTGITAFEVGHPIWYMRGYKFKGIDSETGEPEFEDIDGDGDVDSSDKTDIGKGIPDFTYGLTVNLSYKNFDLIVFGSGASGNDIYQCLTRSDRPTGNRLKLYYDDRWTSTNTSGTRPAASYSESDYYTSSGVIFDGSYFKIKQIQLGYTFSKNTLRRVNFIQKARLYVSMENWFSFTSYPGFDPEASSNSDTSGIGVDKGVYPNSKKMVFGFNVTF